MGIRAARVLVCLLAFFCARFSPASACEGLCVDIGIDVLRPVLEQHIERTQNINDIVMGTWVRGQSHINARSSVYLIPDTTQASFDFRVDGVVNTDTLGQTPGPFRITVSAPVHVTTWVEAHKRFYLTPDGFRTDPTYSGAVSVAHLVGPARVHSGPLRRLLATPRANREAEARMPETAAMASSQVSNQFNQLFDSESRRALEAGNLDYRAHLLPGGVAQSTAAGETSLRFSTTTSILSAYVQPLLNQLRVSSASPPLEPGRSLSLRLQDALATHIANRYLADHVYSEKEADTILSSLLGKTPRVFDSNDTLKFIFPAAQPARVQFRSDQIRIELFPEGFAIGGRDLPGMHCRATLRIVTATDGTPRLERVGNIEVISPDATPETPDALAVQQLVRERLERLIPREMALADLVLGGKLAKVGILRPREIKSASNWLHLAWDRIAPSNTSGHARLE